MASTIRAVIGGPSYRRRFGLGVRELAELLLPAPEVALRFWPVDKKVGQVRNDGLELIEPLVPVETLLL